MVNQHDNIIAIAIRCGCSSKEQKEAVAYMQWMDENRSTLLSLWDRTQSFMEFCCIMWQGVKDEIMSDRMEIERLSVMN